MWRKFREAHGWRFATRNGALHRSCRGACVAVTFIAVLFAWVFFRAKTLPEAGRVVASMAGANGLTIPAGVNDPKRQPGPLLPAEVAAELAIDFEQGFRRPVLHLVSDQRPGSAS